MRIPALAILGACVACTQADPPDSPATGRFTLTGDVGSSHGLILATSEVLPVAAQQVGDVDFYLSIAMVIQLRGPLADGVFCFKGRVDSLAAIPARHADCAWTYADLGGNAPHDSVATNAGYLVRDRFDDRLYRLHIVDDFVDDANLATVVFDLAPALESQR